MKNMDENKTKVMIHKSDDKKKHETCCSLL